MKMKSLLGIMLSLSILQSCQNDETNGIQNEVNKNGITFMSLIDDTNNSRAYDTSWETNDVIGVFMLASENKNILETNVPYVTSKGDGYFISQNQPMYYPENNSTVDFIAYKSRKTKSDGREKRKAIFEAKTKCAQKSRLLPPSGQNTSVVQTPFESCLKDAFLLNFLLKYHLKTHCQFSKKSYLYIVVMLPLCIPSRPHS